MTEEDKITLNMWMARDKHGSDESLNIGYNKPEPGCFLWMDFGDNIHLPASKFKQITWENSPVKVKVTIEIVKQ